MIVTIRLRIVIYHASKSKIKYMSQNLINIREAGGIVPRPSQLIIIQKRVLFYAPLLFQTT